MFQALGTPRTRPLVPAFQNLQRRAVIRLGTGRGEWKVLLEVHPPPRVGLGPWGSV